ncbi:MAG TPA: ABC transporter permease [Syntrophales bacterium]|nr:ABC transporter permease [Syntrophales bacterium]HQN77891.1 ABC transporter permease [Syntrophales bacterium]HQQ27575.1 ABC transporter permease [Syntrophales bacterium]
MISLGMLRDVWKFRDFMWGAVKREFQARWTGTQLGAFWVVAQPLATILIFTLIFSRLINPSLPGHSSRFAYSIYLCSGVLTWNLFAEMLGRSVSIFVENANLLKKIRFPKLCLPIIVLTSSILNFAVILSLFLLFLVLVSAFPGVVVLAALPVLLIQAGFAIGLGILLATVNVFYRDIQQIVQIVLQFWFWLTPIVYAVNQLPGTARDLMSWNPMWRLVQAYQDIFLGHRLPEWSALGYPALLALFFLGLGMFAYHRLQGEIVDEL